MSPLFIPRSEVSQREPEPEKTSGASRTSATSRTSGRTGPSGSPGPSKPSRAAGRSGPGAYEGGWSIERAEELLVSLTGVLSARVVADKEGEVEEIHVLTTTEVTPKQTVRNVESALLAHLDLEVDHRKISVAQTHPGPNLRTVSAAPSATSAPPVDEAEAASETSLASMATAPEARMGLRDQRIVLIGHEVDAVGPRELRVRVQVKWAGGDLFEGTAVGADLPKSRLDMVSRATLRAMESCVKAEETCDGAFTLALDGVRELDAFERRYVLVSVHAITGREVTALAGSAGVSDSPERAVILATLQASDRWVRGRIQYPAERGR